MDQNTIATAPIMGNSEQNATTTSTMGGGKKNDGKGWKIATAIASVVALCGIGFGIYGMVRGLQKDNQISDMKFQVEDSNGKITTLETEKIETTDENSTTVTISDSVLGYRNQILTSSESSKSYSIHFQSSVYLPKNTLLSIVLKDGAISQCNIGMREESGAINYVGANGFVRECEISGISKKIYNIVEFGEGQSSSSSNVGFIMEDGTIQYFSLEDALGNLNFNAEKTLKIDGYVTSTIDVSVTVLPQGGSYGQTMFILNDGSYIGFTQSML